MGFYFAWLSFYTSMLLIPAIPGIALFIYQMTLLYDHHKKGEKLSIDSPYNCLYSLVMSVWSTVLIEIWKRRQNEIAHLWNMTEGSTSVNQQERSEFKADIEIDAKNRVAKRVNTVRTTIRRVYGEVPIVSISVSIVIGCFVGNYLYNKKFKDPSNEIGSSIINAVIIIVLGISYRKLALMMTNWENH